MATTKYDGIAHVTMFVTTNSGTKASEYNIQDGNSITINFKKNEYAQWIQLCTNSKYHPPVDVTSEE